jgi:putative tricarboxylic transport membrane protein
MKFNDAIFGAILLALGAAVLTIVQGYPNIPGQHVGPGLFPGLIATGLCIGGFVLLLRGWAARASAPWVVPGEWARSPRHAVALAVLLGSIVMYMLVADKVGFLPTVMVLLAANFLALKVPPARAVLIAVIATLLIHFAFYKLLRVPLPWGLLTNFAW